MIAALKALHIATLATWCAALLGLPSLVARTTATGAPFEHERLERLVRSLFIYIASPAAVFAIASGTAVLLLRGVFDAWMLLKLAAVGALVGVHLLGGFLLLKAFRREFDATTARTVLATAAVAGLVATILVLVLAKPSLGTGGLPDWLSTPGGLQSRWAARVPMP